jgi:hypothetical protein
MLPASLFDLGKPDLAKPNGGAKLAIAPTDPDLLPLVSAVSAKGRDTALAAWPTGLRENAMIFGDNEGLLRPRHSMKILINHFAGGDVGGLMNISARPFAIVAKPGGCTYPAFAPNPIVKPGGAFAVNRPRKRPDITHSLKRSQGPHAAGPRYFSKRKSLHETGDFVVSNRGGWP